MGRRGVECGRTQGQSGGQKGQCLQLRRALPEGGTEFPQGEEGDEPGDFAGI